nr:hypothetical protein [Tanacetum cinerariifolium]
MGYAVSFACLTATVVEVFIFHGRELWELSKSAFQEKKMDVHINFNYHGGRSCSHGLAFFFTLPIGVITATTNQTPGLNVITEYIIGYLYPGYPIANMCFKVYGYISVKQGVSRRLIQLVYIFPRKPSESLLVLQLGKTLLRPRGIICLGEGAREFVVKPLKDDDVVRLKEIKRDSWPHAHDYGTRDLTNLEPLHAREMLKELKTLFAQQAEQELLQTTRDFHSCRQEEGQSVSSYVLKMKGYTDNLERLGHPVTQGLGVSLILIGLRKEYDGFVHNYNMHSMGKTINELHAMLKLHEQTLPKSNAPALNAIRAGKVQKGNKYKKSHSQIAARGQNHGKGKNKQAYAPKPKISPPPKRENPAKDSICHECREIGHRKRNCPQYLAELMKKKKNITFGAGGSGIFVIELNTILNRSWIYDISCGTHICNTTQGLRASRKLKPGALSLYVGNGQREAVELIGAFYLCLPSGLEIVLNNCDYAPSITRGVISVSRLYKDGFVNRFVDNTIQVSRNNMVYFCVIPRDDIFEIDLSNFLTNESSVYAVRNKRAKLDLDSALLWHCRIGHISKKRIEKLQHDGLLNSSDLTAFKKCVSFMSGKMARKPYTHQLERAKDLIGLIHTDVCVPFKIMSRQGASYFVTFTDDFSRYGYVYLLKHKHEVFETFKVFQKEVENQLGKTIKSLRSDRGGEYMSQEFLDHLKDHGIIAYHTPPYTPQHNGVSERRNRTLLDMVRSMMSQTTLLKSFWDYALETAARILNMVLIYVKSYIIFLSKLTHNQAIMCLNVLLCVYLL